MEKRSPSDAPARRRGLVPLNDLDLRDVAMRVSAAWKSSAFTLAYATPDAFEQNVVDYAVVIDERMNLDASRRPLTGELADLDDAINTHLSNVKAYIAEQFGKERANDYYPEFGIVKVGKTYQFPIDRNERITSIERLVTALTKYGLSNQRYGVNFWKDLQARYVQLIYQAGTTDSQRSARVKDKNELKRDIKQVLQSLVLLVQANYPDTWRSVLRQWGFQKEKY
jgi:hypothetical protein